MPRPPLSDDPSSRKFEKAYLHAQADKEISYVDDGQRIVIHINSAPYVDEVGALVVDDLEVTVDGYTEDVSYSLPWRFVNPPLLIPDDNGDIERRSEQDNGEVRVNRYRNDPSAAFQQMLIDTARRVMG